MKNYKTYVSLMMSLMLIILSACSRDTDPHGYDAEIPNLSFEQSTINVSNEAASYDVVIKSNLPWKAVANVDWITFEKSNGMGDAILKISVDRNRQTISRTAEIDLKITNQYSQKLTIIQAEGDPIPDETRNFYVTTAGVAGNTGFSWASPITLDIALTEATSGDIIHLAAGTYAPTKPITGGNSNDAKDKTFEILENISLIGGYPANASEGSVSKPNDNLTILDGESKVYHVVLVAAPLEADRKVMLKGLTIQGGKAGPATSAVSINGFNFDRGKGGGVTIGKSVAELIDCDIINNLSEKQAAGIYVFNGADARFERCTIKSNNSAAASVNGGGLYIDAASATLVECNVIGNDVSGVGAGIYAFNPGSKSQVTVYNSTISGNKGATNSSAYYGRENSVALFVNTTFHGNNAGGDGSALRLYGGAKADLISSTITGNTSGNKGSINIYAGCTLNIYNSIISGNTVSDITGDYKDMSHSVIGNTLFDASGNKIDGKSFDASTMLGLLQTNGEFTSTCQLIGADNPAKGIGMSKLELQILANSYQPAIAEDIIISDQIGNKRNDTKVTGAFVK